MAGWRFAATPRIRCQTPAPSTLTVALRSLPPGGRDMRNRIHPSFGSRISPQCRFSFRATIAWPGNGTARAARRFLRPGAPAGWSGFHQLS